MGGSAKAEPGQREIMSAVLPDNASGRWSGTLHRQRRSGVLPEVTGGTCANRRRTARTSPTHGERRPTGGGSFANRFVVPTPPTGARQPRLSPPYGPRDGGRRALDGDPLELLLVVRHPLRITPAEQALLHLEDGVQHFLH